MRRLLVILLLVHAVCFGVDFDVVVVGTSPITLLEALYQSHLGKRVLILEEAPICGGAWKSIDVCGVYPVDLGCHTLGKNKQMQTFLETYVGCRMVSLDNPPAPFDSKNSPNGFYPLQGCYEIIHNLLELIKHTDIVLLLEHPLENVTIHPQRPEAVIVSRNMYITTSKIIAPTYCSFQPAHMPGAPPKSSYYHLYLLIDDPTPQRFSFRSGVLSGASRLMNLTYFAGLSGTSKQLIVIQTYGSSGNLTAKDYLDALKKQGLFHESARLLEEETYVYEQATFKPFNHVPNATQVIEQINTGHIESMAQYIPRWEKVLKPYTVALSSEGN
jgi:hypothetical protein